MMSAVDSRPFYLRSEVFWLLLISAYAFLATYLFAYHSLRIYDIWWHLGIGNWMLSHGSIPRQDYFSWTMLHKPWVNPEWGSQIVFAWFFEKIGFQSLILLTNVLTFLILICVGISTRVVTGSRVAPFLALFFTGYLMFIRLTARPHLFKILFVAVLTLVLMAHRRGKLSIRVLYLMLVPLFVLWTNMHGSVFFGIGLIGLYWFGGCLQLSLHHKKIVLQPGLFGVLVVCGLVTLINPYFYGVHLLALEHMGLQHILMNTIEWMSPFVHPGLKYSIPMALYLASLLMVLITVIRRWREIHWGELAAGMALIYLSLRHSRFMAIYASWAIPWLCSYWWPRAHNSWAGTAHRLAVYLLPIFFVVTVFYIGHLPIEWSGRGEAFEGGMNNIQYDPPIGVTHFIKSNGLANTNPRLFNEMTMGAFLIYEGIPVFFDGRTPLYGDRFFESYMDLTGSPEEFFDLEAGYWEWTMMIFDNLDRDFTRLFNYLLDRPDWHLVYVDYKGSVFLKATSENLELIARYRIAQHPFIDAVRKRALKP